MTTDTTELETRLEQAELIYEAAFARFDRIRESFGARRIGIPRFLEELKRFEQAKYAWERAFQARLDAECQNIRE